MPFSGFRAVPGSQLFAPSGSPTQTHSLREELNPEAASPRASVPAASHRFPFVMGVSITHGMAPRWICDREKTLIQSPFLKVVSRECRASDDGRTHSFVVFRSRDWCNVIPVTEDGRVVLVRQFRAGIDGDALEIPGGVVDDSDGAVREAALREMTEETGYVPLEGAKCLDLGWAHPNPAIQNNRVHSFIVGPVLRDRAQKLDPGEMMDVVEVPIEEIPEKILSGEINHALILNAFLLLAFQDAKFGDSLKSILRSFTATRGSSPLPGRGRV